METCGIHATELLPFLKPVNGARRDFANRLANGELFRQFKLEMVDNT